MRINISTGLAKKIQYITRRDFKMNTDISTGIFLIITRYDNIKRRY